MTEKERIIEVLDAIENGMCKVAETRDIWQNDLIYALCEGERILLTARLKELNKKKKEPEKKTMTCREWVEKNRPELISSMYLGGVCGCPSDYGLEPGSFDCDNDGEANCSACWNRPIRHGPFKE